jgi:hypothetical protein
VSWRVGTSRPAIVRKTRLAAGKRGEVAGTSCGANRASRLEAQSFAEDLSGAYPWFAWSRVFLSGAAGGALGWVRVGSYKDGVLF